MRWAHLRNLGERAETTCSLEGALRDLMAEPMAPIAIELRASPNDPRCSLAAKRREGGGGDDEEEEKDLQERRVVRVTWMPALREDPLPP